MIYLIDPTTETYGHHIIYLNSLLKIEGTRALQLNVDTRRMKPNFLTVFKYYLAIRKQLRAVPKGNIAHLLYSDIYYKIPFVTSRLLQRNKTIVTMHSCPSGKIKHWLMKNFCKRVSAVIVHSEYIKNQLENLGLTNIHYVDYPSFYDYSQVPSRNELKKREGLKVSDVVFSALGGIRQDKGLDILLEAFKYIDVGIKKNIVLNVAGKEGFLTAKDVEEICQRNGIRARLNIRPLTDEEFMENVEISDYMVMPYRCNMTGNSGPMTEAIVRSIPSIVPAESNLGYIAEHYHVGICFKQENAKKLARIIETCFHKKIVCDPSYTIKLREETFIKKHRQIYSLVNSTNC